MPEVSGPLQEDSLGGGSHILYHLNLWHRTFAERSAVCSNVLGQVSGASMSYVRRSDDSFMKLYYSPSKMVKVFCKLVAINWVVRWRLTSSIWERLMGYLLLKLL